MEMRGEFLPLISNHRETLPYLTLSKWGQRSLKRANRPFVSHDIVKRLPPIPLTGGSCI
jgi:hypothetical protein